MLNEFSSDFIFILWIEATQQLQLFIYLNSYLEMSCYVLNLQKICCWTQFNIIYFIT